MNDDGDGKILKFKEKVDALSKAEYEKLKAEGIKWAKIEGDTEGTERIKEWLEGRQELSEIEIEILLQKLPLLLYERQRKAIAKKLGIRAGVLDQIRNPKRGEEEPGQGTGILFKEIIPFPESVDGSVLLDDLAGTLKKYMVLPAGAADALALWITFTYLHNNFDISPLLCVTSPEKRCGKTTLLSILGQLTARALPASNITSAALFRTVEQFEPTLLVDEVDTFIRGSDELRGILNSGHLKSQAFVIRTVGDDFEPRVFKTWCPKAIALIGKLAPTLADRSIIIPLQRKGPAEKVERLRLGRLAEDTERLRQKLARWTEDISRFVGQIEAKELGFLTDRAADNWRPLLMIADAAGEDWVNRAVRAARLLSIGVEDDELGPILLQDLEKIFAEKETDRLSSTEIVEMLVQQEDKPWPEYKKGKPLTKRQLAIILKRYGIRPKPFKNQGDFHRGYFYNDLQPVFIRYSATNLDNSMSDNELPGCTSVDENATVADRSATRNRSATVENELNFNQCKKLNDPVAEVADKSGNEDKEKITTLLSEHWRDHDSDGGDGGIPLF
ncbi:MAG: DUF3631 domain-containing protein [Planctomycetes bacterium]|nr:DUF3631 domain-containing protein [Planctomycetota bacterium]